jgi:predicted Fe-S protein YdhL (DUF1289 family)
MFPSDGTHRWVRVGTGRERPGERLLDRAVSLRMRRMTDATISTDDFPVASPCVSVCSVDGRTGFCLGCWRTLKEIAQWGRLSNGERRDVLRAIRERQADAGVDRRRVTRREAARRARSEAGGGSDRLDETKTGDIEA